MATLGSSLDRRLSVRAELGGALGQVAGVVEITDEELETDALAAIPDTPIDDGAEPCARDRMVTLARSNRCAVARALR